MKSRGKARPPRGWVAAVVALILMLGIWRAIEWVNRAPASAAAAAGLASVRDEQAAAVSVSDRDGDAPRPAGRAVLHGSPTALPFGSEAAAVGSQPGVSAAASPAQPAGVDATDPAAASAQALLDIGRSAARVTLGKDASAWALCIRGAGCDPDALNRPIDLIKVPAQRPAQK
jgi:hypothetical protein